MGPLGDSDRRGSGDESLAFVFVRGSSTGLCAGDPSTGVMSAHVLWKVRRPPSDHRETAGMCQKEHRLREPDMKGPSKLTGRAWAASPLLLLSIPTGSAWCRGPPAVGGRSPGGNSPWRRGSVSQAHPRSGGGRG